MQPKLNTYIVGGNETVVVVGGEWKEWIGRKKERAKEKRLFRKSTVHSEIQF